jgi:arsenate reductase
MAVSIYHNPRCSKSRQTLDLLRAGDVEPRIIEYLQTPPSADELRQILALLGIGPRDLMRKKEAEYKAAGLDDPALDDDALIAAMVAAPILIERPIVVHGGKAVLGRPPENVLDIL